MSVPAANPVPAANLEIYVQPGARRSEFAGWHGGLLKVKIAAPPVEGKANKVLLEFLARSLGVSKTQLALAGGEHARQKRLRIAGLSPAELDRKLQALVADEQSPTQP